MNQPAVHLVAPYFATRVMKAHATETQTRAPKPLGMIRDHITGVARDPTFAEAVAFARAMPGGARASDFNGLHRCRGGTGDECGGVCRVCCRVCPIYVYNSPCGNGCTDIVWCWYGIPIPLFSCITAFACKEEDEAGAFIARDKQQQKSCALVPLDPSTGRYAVYVAHCQGCGTDFREDSEPACVAESMFAPAVQI